MFRLDDNLLRELGLGELPVDEKNKMLAHIYETLEMRVGMRLAEQMTDQQLDEFESFIDTNDEAGALHWLEANFPDYKQVVADELEKLKNEIRQHAPAILEAARQDQAHAQAPPINVTAASAQPSMPGQAPASQPMQSAVPSQPAQPQQYQAHADPYAQPNYSAPQVQSAYAPADPYTTPAQSPAASAPYPQPSADPYAPPMPPSPQQPPAQPQYQAPPMPPQPPAQPYQPDQYQQPPAQQ